MLVAAICARNHKSAIDQIQNALTYSVDAVELRLDYFDRLILAEVGALKKHFDIPVIFTLRKQSQGGLFKGTEGERLKIIEDLFSVNPEYFDLECEVAHSFAMSMHRKHPRVKLICSYHNFNETPQDLNKILTSMIQNEFSIYKIATKANSSIDTLRMLNFVREKSQQMNISGLCMGGIGQSTRILSPIVNNYLNYASIGDDNNTAPGQLDLETLFTIYNYKSINQKTQIYALLGDPVEQSIGHVFHNSQFKKIKQNAVYIKLQVKEDEFPEFFKEVSKLPFNGFSVTMPLKEKVLPFLGGINVDAEKIKAINTIIRKEDQYVGFNTDGIGALNAIEKRTKVKNKKMIVIGAGGTARAIVYEATKRGANVIVLNRTLNKAQNIAKDFNCMAYGIDYIEKLNREGYDILINTTPIGMKNHKNTLLISNTAIIPEAIILDMVYKAQETELLKLAKSKKCVCISGKEVFINQAIEQEKIWISHV